MTRTLAAGRTWGFCISLTLAVLSIIAAIQSYRWNASFLQWFDDIPMRVEIDPTIKSDYQTSYIQTCEISHGAFLVCSEPVEPSDYNSEVKKLANLRGTFQLKSENGNATMPVEFRGDNTEYRLGRISFLRIPMVRNGTYSAEIQILDNLDSDASQPIQFMAKYELCGLENLPSQLLCWAAIGLGAIGGLGLLIVVPNICERGFYERTESTIA